MKSLTQLLDDILGLFLLCIGEYLAMGRKEDLTHLLDEREYVLHCALEVFLVHCIITTRQMANNCRVVRAWTIPHLTNLTYHQEGCCRLHYPLSKVQ